MFPGAGKLNTNLHMKVAPKMCVVVKTQVFALPVVQVLVGRLDKTS